MPHETVGQLVQGRESSLGGRCRPVGADNSSALVREVGDIPGTDSPAFRRKPCRGSCELAAGIPRHGRTA